MYKKYMPKNAEMFLDKRFAQPKHYVDILSCVLFAGRQALSLCDRGRRGERLRRDIFRA